MIQKFLVAHDTLLDKLFTEDGPEFGPHVDQRLHNNVDITLLVLERVALCAVEEGGNCVIQLAFEVTLLEVLFHFSGHPLEVNDRAFSRVNMVSYIDRHVEDQLLVFHGVLRELLGAQAALKGHYLFEVVAHIRRQDHLDYDLSHVPVLRFTQQLEDVV